MKRTKAPRRPEELLAKRGGVVELLRLPSALFSAVARLRGLLYDKGLLPSTRVEVPVVCVGNISAGGTGKTPMVVWLAKRLQGSGHRPGILSRGYGKSGVSGAESDEARLYAELLGDLPRVAMADRVEGVGRLVELGAGLVLMDDGFQHRRLARDLDLVLVDATRPWGLPPASPGAIPVRASLPRGLLRESPAALGRAAAIVITRCDQVTAADLANLEAELQNYAPLVPRLLAKTAPSSLEPLFPELENEPTTAAPESLAGKRVELLSAIGNPGSFEAGIESLGAVLCGHLRFPDHHEFVAEDVANLGEAGTLVVVTAKDAVKLRGLGREAFAKARAGVVVLHIDFVLMRGEELLQDCIDTLPEGSVHRQLSNLHEGLHG